MLFQRRPGRLAEECSTAHVLPCAHSMLLYMLCLLSNGHRTFHPLCMSDLHSRQTMDCMLSKAVSCNQVIAENINLLSDTESPKIPASHALDIPLTIKAILCMHAEHSTLLLVWHTHESWICKGDFAAALPP